MARRSCYDSHLHVAHGSEVVDFRWTNLAWLFQYRQRKEKNSYISDDFHEVGRVGEVSIVQHHGCRCEKQQTVSAMPFCEWVTGFSNK